MRAAVAPRTSTKKLYIILLLFLFIILCSTRKKNRHTLFFYLCGIFCIIIHVPSAATSLYIHNIYIWDANLYSSSLNLLINKLVFFFLNGSLSSCRLFISRAHIYIFTVGVCLLLVSYKKIHTATFSYPRDVTRCGAAAQRRKIHSTVGWFA